MSFNDTQPLPLTFEGQLMITTDCHKIVMLVTCMLKPKGYLRLAGQELTMEVINFPATHVMEKLEPPVHVCKLLKTPIWNLNTLNSHKF